MSAQVRPRRVAVVALAAVCLARPALADAAPAHLAGFVRGLDGRPAVGLRVRLLDARGTERARATADRSGSYALDVAAGDYALVLEAPDSGPIPVLAPPLRLAEGTLARRDVQLVEAHPTSVAARLGRLDAKLAEWWKTAPTGGKVALVAGIVVGVGFGIAALSGSDAEAPASAF